MRYFIVLLMALTASAARGDDIVDVLQRSQQARLASLPAAPGGARAGVVQASFEVLCRNLRFDDAPELRIIRGPVLAETLQGNVVAVNEFVGDLPENARRFILAHELGHVALGHWAQMGLVFHKWVPGDVTPERTDSVAAELGAEASTLAHRQEFEADAYAARALSDLGSTRADIVAIFVQLGNFGDTATHPSVRKRGAALRDLDLPAHRHEVASVSKAIAATGLNP